MERFKNLGLWTAIFALVGLILQDTGIYPANYPDYVETICQILIFAGVVSNPTQGLWYTDKPKEKK